MRKSRALNYEPGIAHEHECECCEEEEDEENHEDEQDGAADVVLEGGGLLPHLGRVQAGAGGVAAPIGVPGLLDDVGHRDEDLRDVVHERNFFETKL